MRRLALALCGLSLACAAQAESLASSASSAASASLGSLSTSLHSISHSSDGGGRRAEGRYRVTDVADAGAGRVTLKLTPAAEGGEAFALTLPVAALTQRTLTAGDAVQATAKPYGIEFAYADNRQTFFLALDDAWHAELATRPL
jgi:hypothetical protein